MRRARTGLIISMIAAFLCVASASAGGEPSGLVPMDEFELQVPADPQISPDGRRIVYVRQFADVQSDKRYSNLWLIASDGSGERPLTAGNHSDSSPRWSPDGTRLAYVSDVDGKPQLYVRWMDSGQSARLTQLEEAPADLAWSPDGRWISFSSFVTVPPPHLADLPSAPSGAKWAEPPAIYDRLVYRFNGEGYLKPGNRQIFVISSLGGTPRQVTSGDFPNGGSPLVSNQSGWTPDAKTLIVSANRHPEGDLEPFDSEVYEISVADGALRALTHRKGPDDNAVLSPDGQWIAYTGYDDRYQGHQTQRLYVMRRDGGGSHVLSSMLDRDIESPRWAPDNSGVYFLYDDQGDRKLGFLSLSGRQRVIAEHVSAGLGAGGSGAFSVSRTGAISFTRGDSTTPGDIAVWSAGQLRTLTALNAELLHQHPPGRVEEIRYPSAKDQRPIQGWIVYPPQFDPGHKYPLILEIHGGPFANYGDRFDFEKQVYAAHGYVVFYANPRGSTSYGEEFANLIHHAYPGDDFYDLDSGVDAVIAKGFIDDRNLFVTGGSGGGVLTCWVIEHSQRYRAAASLYPVINWYSFALTSDIPFITRYWFPGNPWEHTEQYVQRSLTYLVGKVSTPTLLMTGEADYRTPISEAEQFYGALKLRGIEALLVRVPGEPHGIRRRPSHHMAKMLYVEHWFDRHQVKP